MTVSPEPYNCPPITDAVLDDYELLVKAGLAPRLRAWVRETDKACRANSALLRKE